MNEEPDSLLAIAAQIVEVASHISAYMDSSDPGAEKLIPSLAFRLGRLEVLFNVYRIDGASQGARRLGKSRADPYDGGRHDRIRSFHAGLVAAGARDATKQTAEQFEITRRQVSNILNGSDRK